MQHRIEFIDSGDMPDGHDWILVRDQGETVFFLNRERVTPAVMGEMWAACRYYAEAHALVAV